jgi:5-methylcytosine-specific restriction endonuclease McrA
MSKKDIRANFRSEVYKRDKHTCRVCNTKRQEDELDAHHITDRSFMPGGGYVATNGITVCKDTCHMKVEQYHITGGLIWDDNLHPKDLYRMINSSYEKACDDSLKLE